MKLIKKGRKLDFSLCLWEVLHLWMTTSMQLSLQATPKHGIFADVCTRLSSAILIA